MNVDHVATLRQARGTNYPDPLAAALLAEASGCDGITVHLREDRRHIQDADVLRLRDEVGTMLNLEMAATQEMLKIALSTGPDLVTLVPERREERTTEGGLDVGAASVERVVRELHGAGRTVALFIDPDLVVVEQSAALSVSAIELHTGDFAHAPADERAGQLERIRTAAERARELGLTVAAGHGLTVDNTESLVAAVPAIAELNIGHALVSDAVLVGLEASVGQFRDAIDRGVRGRN